MSVSNGIVYLIGAGPGETDLITVRGMNILRKADCVVFDYLADSKLPAFAPDHAEKVYVGKKAGDHTLSQEDINRLLIEKASAGNRVARLKGGDPFVFGRGGEEAEALARAGVRFEVIPGITSGIAAPLFAGIPVTHRGRASSVALVTGHENPSKDHSAIQWEHLGRGVDTLVFYMGVKNLPLIVHNLLNHGRAPSTPAALVRWGARPSQKTITGTLENIADLARDADLRPPAVIVVGDVVAMRSEINWFENRPLFGRCVINTRSSEQASALSASLSERGAQVLELPAIRIVPRTIPEIQRALDTLSEFDWVMFTSANAAELFFQSILSVSGDIRALGNARIAAVGPATSRVIERYFLKVSLSARSGGADGLIEELRKAGDWRGKRVLVPISAQARDVLPGFFQKRGADCTVVPVYDTVAPKHLDKAIVNRIVASEYDLISFTSSSTVDHFVDMMRNGRFEVKPETIRAASIGPQTSATLRRHGIEPVSEAVVHTIDGLVDAIQEYLK